MEIREANISDKNSVLKFCKNTFSWGDYIEKVWSSWLDEGNLFLFEKQSPVGICHAFYSENQIWIEGIRIDPKHRREMIASKLVTYAESIGKKNQKLFSYMLIDTQNKNSIENSNFELENNDSEDVESALNPEQLSNLLVELKAEMENAAKQLDFERAARLRDRIFRMEQLL